MANKEANEKYIVDEEIEFLGAPVGHNFEEPEHQVAGYESIKVELMSSSDYKDWVKGAFYSSLVTWDTTPQLPVTKMLDWPFEEIERKLMFMLTKRPISVALESAVFNFKITGIPRAMTHQIVRHRQMAFGQQSYRVSSCYSDPVRIPVTLMEKIENKEFGAAQHYVNYVNAVKNVRKVYKDLIEYGIPMEQARCIMPMGTCTKIGVTMRLRDMIEYFKGRTSDIAQDEHTYMVCLMAKEMRDNQPEFFKFITTQAKNLEAIMEKYGVE
jgi:Predicted alternative thymidylate synthase